jgi:hypothetical protein
LQSLRHEDTDGLKFEIVSSRSRTVYGKKRALFRHESSCIDLSFAETEMEESERGNSFWAVLRKIAKDLGSALQRTVLL